jgi:hypothetical protein
MAELCENTIEIKGNENNLKKIENILILRKNKEKVYLFNELCGDFYSKFKDVVNENSYLCDVIRFDSEDVEFNKVKYHINDKGIQLNFRTRFYCPIKFINKLALEYDVSVTTIFSEDHYLGAKTFTIDYTKIKKELEIK